MHARVVYNFGGKMFREVYREVDFPYLVEVSTHHYCRTPYISYPSLSLSGEVAVCMELYVRLFS